MKFKLDENLPVEAADRLKEAGHDIVTVLEQQLGGATDRILAAVCQQENRAIIMLDLDFADIRTYPPADFSGLIVPRLKRQDRFHVLHVIDRLLEFLPEPELAQKLWIVDEQRIRIHQ